jgi:hypothetical protein
MVTTASACVWSTNLNGMIAWSIPSTDGLGPLGSSIAERVIRTISVSESSPSVARLRSTSGLTAVKPDRSMSRKSTPLPVMYMARSVSPNTLVTSVLTEVFPPPCSTRVGSRP